MSKYCGTYHYAVTYGGNVVRRSIVANIWTDYLNRSVSPMQLMRVAMDEEIEGFESDHQDYLAELNRAEQKG